MSVQMLLAPDAMLAPSSMLLDLLLQPSEVVEQIIALPPANDAGRTRQAQRDWWPEDAQAVDRERTKPRSMGLDALTDLERSFSLELEIRKLPELRHLPVVNELPDRKDCAGGARPCPLVSCPFNNYLSHTPGGAARLNFPHLEPWEVPKNLSCALDLADEGATVNTVATALNMTEERVRQIQVGAFAKLRKTRVGREWLRGVRGG